MLAKHSSHFILLAWCVSCRSASCCYDFFFVRSFVLAFSLSLSSLRFSLVLCVHFQFAFLSLSLARSFLHRSMLLSVFVCTVHLCWSCSVLAWARARSSSFILLRYSFVCVCVCVRAFFPNHSYGFFARCSCHVFDSEYTAAAAPCTWYCSHWSITWRE